MIDKKIDEKESEKMRLIYNHYINKQDEIKKFTQFRFDEVFGKFIPKVTISPEQITKLNNFFSENKVKININIKFNLFKPRKKKNVDTEPNATPYYE